MISVLLEIIRLKKMLLIAAGVLLAANLAVYFFRSSYQAPAIEKSQQQWNDLRRRVAAAGRLDVNALYAKGKSDLERIRNRYPLKREFPRVLGDILSAASASTVSTGNITYKPQAVKDENLLAYGVSMSVSGGYASIKSFLADLQNQSEMVVIDKVTLTNNDYFEEKVSMELRLTVYLREGA